MSAVVDVLAVMDRCADSARKIVAASDGDPRAALYLQDVERARAAVAELIKAMNRAKPEIQQAEFVLRNAGATVTADYLKQRMEPLFAALARVGGA